MTKSVLITVSLACGLVIGAGLDRYVMAASPARKSAEAGAGHAIPLASQRAPMQQASNPSASLDPMQMRAMLREELGTALSTALVGANGKAVDPGSRQVSAPASVVPPQQQQEAMVAINEIIGAGQWGEQERMNFHQKLAQLDPAQVEQAMQKLVQAIDNGTLKAANGGLPML